MLSEPIGPEEAYAIRSYAVEPAGKVWGTTPVTGRPKNKNKKARRKAAQVSRRKNRR